MGAFQERNTLYLSCAVVHVGRIHRRLECKHKPRLVAHHLRIHLGAVVNQKVYIDQPFAVKLCDVLHSLFHSVIQDAVTHLSILDIKTIVRSKCP